MTLLTICGGGIVWTCSDIRLKSIADEHSLISLIYILLKPGTLRRRTKMGALFMEEWRMEPLSGEPKSVNSTIQFDFNFNLIFTPMFWSPQVYLGSDFRSLLTGMVSIDARGRVGMQEVREDINGKKRFLSGIARITYPPPDPTSGNLVIGPFFGTSKFKIWKSV